MNTNGHESIGFRSNPSRAGTAETKASIWVYSCPFVVVRLRFDRRRGGLTGGKAFGCISLLRNMADFPDIVEAPLRARFVSVDARPEAVGERLVRGSGTGGPPDRASQFASDRFLARPRIDR